MGCQPFNKVDVQSNSLIDSTFAKLEGGFAYLNSVTSSEIKVASSAF